MYRSVPVLAAAVLAVSVASFPACGMHGPYNAEARDTWSHTYTLSKTGEVSIANVNGSVDVQGVDGSTVEVQAERVAHAATEQMAKDLLPKIPINDRSTADLVFVETGRVAGILIGASYDVRYHVKAPKGATVRATTVNGAVDLQGLSGRATARVTNGNIDAKDLSGGLDARAVNGRVRAGFAALAAHDITLGIVNGAIRVSLPANAKATVNATWVNGGFNSSGLQFDVRDQGKRHFEGLLNGGGTSITVNTVNGGVHFDTGLGKDADGDDDNDEPARSRKKTVDHVAP